ncbi:MAG: MFS transporter, partial [Burkholderiaceae bacterium]|nr:MFS transporter [Burkholderiaceae bacterium]
GSVPLVAFLVVVALCQLPFASLSLRLGRRRGLMGGAAVAAVGYALSGMTTDFWVFTLARVLSALGFALVFVSSQGAVVDGSDDRNRTPSLAVFVRAILVAGLCGPPLGGLLADRWGVSVVFALGAWLCVLAVALAWHSVATPHPYEAADVSVKGDTGLVGVPAVWRSPGLRSLMVGAAVPAKLMLAATCFYLVPIGLAQQGYSSSEIGRFLMIYPLLMVLGVAPLAAWARRLDRQRGFVVVGGLLAGAGGLLGLVPLNDTTVVALLVLLGIGQAMSVTSQTQLVLVMAERVRGLSSSQVLGFFRMLERGGSALGPAVGAGLLGALGLGPAIAITGGVVIV